METVYFAVISVQSATICILVVWLVKTLHDRDELRKTSDLFRDENRRRQLFIDEEANGWNRRLKEAGLTDD